MALPGSPRGHPGQCRPVPVRCAVRVHSRSPNAHLLVGSAEERPHSYPRNLPVSTSAVHGWYRLAVAGRACLHVRLRRLYRSFVRQQLTVRPVLRGRTTGVCHAQAVSGHCRLVCLTDSQQTSRLHRGDGVGQQGAVSTSCLPRSVCATTAGTSTELPSPSTATIVKQADVVGVASLSRGLRLSTSTRILRLLSPVS